MKKLISIILTITLSFSALYCVNCFADNETTCDNIVEPVSSELTGSTTSDTICNIYGDGKSFSRKKTSTLKKVLIGTFSVALAGTLAACALFKDTILEYINGSIKTLCNSDYGPFCEPKECPICEPTECPSCEPPVDDVAIKSEECKNKLNGKTIPLVLGNKLRYTCSAASKDQLNNFIDILSENKELILDLMSTPETDPELINAKKKKVCNFFESCVLNYSECKMVTDPGWYSNKIPNEALSNFRKAFKEEFDVSL